MNLQEYCEYCYKNRRPLWFFQTDNKYWKNIVIFKYFTREFDELDRWLREDYFQTSQSLKL